MCLLIASSKYSANLFLSPTIYMSIFNCSYYMFTSLATFSQLSLRFLYVLCEAKRNKYSDISRKKRSYKKQIGISQKELIATYFAAEPKKSSSSLPSKFLTFGLHTVRLVRIKPFNQYQFRRLWLIDSYLLNGEVTNATFVLINY